MLGIKGGNISSYPYVAIVLLYLGPLYSAHLSRKLPLQRNWSFAEDVFPILFTWPGVRNYMVGPLTEEVVFRGCILVVYRLAGASVQKMLFFSPILFGLGELDQTFTHLTC